MESSYYLSSILNHPTTFPLHYHVSLLLLHWSPSSSFLPLGVRHYPQYNLNHVRLFNLRYNFSLYSKIPSSNWTQNGKVWTLEWKIARKVTKALRVILFDDGKKTSLRRAKSDNEANNSIIHEIEIWGRFVNSTTMVSRFTIYCLC